MHKIAKFLLVFLVVSFLQPLLAQDGEKLFKQCFTCHTLGKKSTGPNLVGVREKWIAAGEGDLLPDWVKNSEALIASGKSTMANAIKGFSPTAMPPQVVTNEDVNAIFDYIDAWTPPVAATSDTANAKVPEVIFVPNYNANLSLFYWLLFAGFVLILAILLLSGSIQNLLKSDYFKERMAKLKENGTPIIIFFLTIGVLVANNHSFAFSFNGPGIAEKGDPWLLIERSDIYALTAIDLILLGVVLYMRSVFNQIIGLVRKPVPRKVKQKRVASKINKVLTDSVPIEEESTILMNHEYDGIQELDNNLPPWWLWGFYASIVFAVIYLLNFHVFKISKLQIEAYNTEMEVKKKEVNDYLTKMAMNVDENSATLMLDATNLDQGKATFETNCATCHLSDGTGKIGPNLTDKTWIYGYDVKDLFKTIKYGTSNGMPEHASKLKPTQIQQVASFILSLPEKTGLPPNGTIQEK